jgi:hypothetical protein
MNDAPRTGGGEESGQAQSSGPYGGTGNKDTYDRWYGVGEGMEVAKNEGKSFSAADK